MNGDAKALIAGTVIFPHKQLPDAVSEGTSNKIEETAGSEIRKAPNQNRFSRLRKSLRKRAKSIF